MSSIKNPENEAQDPAPMPKHQQGQGGHSRDGDLAGQRGGKKAKMAPQPSAPPGLEQDNRGNATPFEQRTEDDQEMARGQNQTKSQSHS
ncbi:MAG: hypothetical protein H7X89_14550, partial [Rhizobiales bacterium]|nr:hypothetical protein [Hyphomicrobiales bacterium]